MTNWFEYAWTYHLRDWRRTQVLLMFVVFTLVMYTLYQWGWTPTTTYKTLPDVLSDVLTAIQVLGLHWLLTRSDQPWTT